MAQVTLNKPKVVGSGISHNTTPPLTLYVHFPWCVRKCPYCDFNSHPARGEVPEAAYIDALIKDLDMELPQIWGRRIHAIFMGGGTPSLFSGKGMSRLMSEIRARLNPLPDCEITLEANPGTVDQNNFDAYRAAGINRLSIGAQSFNNDSLQRLGRIHQAGDIDRAFQAARAAGFDNINLDLMYGLPDQTVAQAVDDLQQAIDLAPEHLSLYQLTIEPHTEFHARPPVLPDDDALWDMHVALAEQLRDADYQHYEISAHARPGKRCRHNLNYWRFGDYIGIGAGAHGKITLHDKVLRRWKHKHPQHYLEHAGSTASIGDEQSLNTEDRVTEYLLNILRIDEGFSAEQFLQATGAPLARIETGLNEAARRGMIEYDHTGVKVTETGHRFLNDLLALLT